MDGANGSGGAVTTRSMMEEAAQLSSISHDYLTGFWAANEAAIQA